MNTPARAHERPAPDTMADDCAADFLGDLDEALWVLRDAQRPAGAGFRHAARKREHIDELRRLIGRMRGVLDSWESAGP